MSLPRPCKCIVSQCGLQGLVLWGIVINPLKTSPKYTRAGFYGKCVLLQNQIIFNGLKTYSIVLVDFDWIFINLLKSAAFTLQTSKHNLKNLLRITLKDRLRISNEWTLDKAMYINLYISVGGGGGGARAEQCFLTFLKNTLFVVENSLNQLESPGLECNQIL